MHDNHGASVPDRAGGLRPEPLRVSAEGAHPLRENIATLEGRALGVEIARLCDREAARLGRDGRCATCACRSGDHVANGSPETLMSFVKCIAEREPFFCHEEDRPCAGYLLMRFGKEETVPLPWDYVGGAD